MNNKNRTRYLAYSAIMIAFTIVLGFFPGIPLGFLPAPIVLQNMGITMMALLLGARYGTISVGIFLALAFIGLPVLTGGHGGAAVFSGPTGGYLIAWLFVPLVMNLLLRIFGVHKKHNFIFELIAVLLTNLVFVDGVGAIWIAMQTHISIIKSMIYNLAFVPGDVIKSTLAVLIVDYVRKSAKLNITENNNVNN